MLARLASSWISRSVVLVAALGLAGCQPEPEPLAGDYRLTESTGFEPLAETEVRISFSEERFGFNAGCNQYDGDYEIADGVFIMDGYATTRVGCDEARDSQDAWLVEFFTGEPAITVEASRVVFARDSVTLTVSLE